MGEIISIIIDALQILDFTLNMPHEILGPVALPPP